MANQQRAQEHQRVKESNQNRIKQLEEIEQRMVTDLQRTLQMKNQAINELQNKSKSLKKVMQPRMAYKYAPKEASMTDLINANAQSHYQFNGRRSSGKFGSKDDVMSMYGRRAKSIVTNQDGHTAAPPSGNEVVAMFADNSAAVLNDKGSPGKNQNEIVIISPAPKSEAPM